MCDCFGMIYFLPGILLSHHPLNVINVIEFSVVDCQYSWALISIFGHLVYPTILVLIQNCVYLFKPAYVLVSKNCYDVSS